ncbi:MAG: AI-2E family transporter [Thermodesulfobacteriota bacterium]
MTPTAWRTLIRVGAALCFMAFVVWLMRALESVTTLILVAFFLAYILDPPTDRLESWGVRRSLAAFVVLFGGLFLVLSMVLFLVPKILRETAAFAGQAHQHFSGLWVQLVPLMSEIGLQIPGAWREILDVIQRELPNLVPELSTRLQHSVTTLTRSTAGIVSALVHVLLVPVLVYYFLVPFKHIKETVADLIPAYHRSLVLRKMAEIDRVLAAFVRGQLTICVFMAIMYSAAFLIIGIDLPVVLGMLGGMLFIIPYAGTMVALVAGSLMALAKFGDPVYVVYVVASISAIQLVEAYVITPKIVGEAVGLHPGAYILALLIGAKLFGVVGLLVAVPVAAVLKVLIGTLIEYYRDSYLYKDTPIEDHRAARSRGQ